MNWVDYLPYGFFGLAILVLLVAVFVSWSIRRSVAKHDEEQRLLALAIEEERHAEAKAEADLAYERNSLEDAQWWAEIDGPTDRPYLRREWT
jgi:hypothetical protein